MRRFLPFACLLLPLSMVAQNPPSTSKAEAKAEARANATANGSGVKSKRSSSSQTVTHKVVVENGKTIIDEKRVDGKLVRSGKGRGPLNGASLGRRMGCTGSRSTRCIPHHISRCRRLPSA